MMKNSKRIRSTGPVFSFLWLPALMVATLVGCNQADQRPAELPNILWITSEDNSAYFLGCYGNSMADTPNLDQLAAEGFLYTRAYANNPVCAPARNTIISGVYSAANGTEQMRSRYPMSEIITLYPELLRKAGYYCTNNVKTDYNFQGDYNAIWDECSRQAHYKNRADGQPFFAIFNLFITHESQIHTPIPSEKLKHDPEKVEIAPYHPDTPEIRHDWAQYYDRNTQLDTIVGRLLEELEASGETENTIVFYYGDHGGVLARSKRFVYETGTRIPFIVRIPEKYRYLYPASGPGEKVDRPVSFVDLVPTLLSIAGVPLPDYLQGDAFLGEQKTTDPEYVVMTRQRMDERYDMVRAVRDKQYRYIRNYMPFRISMQHVDYLYRAPSARSWLEEFEAGRTNELQSRYFYEKPLEELYDTEKDPWEIMNLAEDPAYREVLEKMRLAETDWMRDVRDVGLVPETDYRKFAAGGSMFDYMRSESCPFDELLEAAQKATSPGLDHMESYVQFLENGNSAIRYWGAVGLLIHREEAGPVVGTLERASKDESSAVATIAAETLFRMGRPDPAMEAYNRILADTVSYGMTDRNFALNSIDAVGARSPEIVRSIRDFYERNVDRLKGLARYDQYDILMAEYVLKKWGEIQHRSNF